MPGKEKKFEEEIKDLETLVNQIDSGELTLEESINAFERGVALVKSLNRKLDEVERKVELLTRNADGQLQSSSLDHELGEKPRADDDQDDESFGTSSDLREMAAADARAARYRDGAARAGRKPRDRAAADHGGAGTDKFPTR
jgi:exodeoxyribonuclease VII small subunit